MTVEHLSVNQTLQEKIEAAQLLVSQQLHAAKYKRLRNQQLSGRGCCRPASRDPGPS